jgi:large subunit ribosomal protein L18
MNILAHKRKNAFRRANRVRAHISGTPERPRMTVNISNKNISVQVVDDSKNSTLVSASTVGQKVKGTMTERAAWVGKEIAGKAKKAKVNKVVLDRGSYKYHGRIKALADAAREGGLEF